MFPFANGSRLDSFKAATLKGLTPLARLLLTVLDRKAKGHDECWCSNETLRTLLGCCERTIRNAIRALEAEGLILIERDYSLRSRRRIILLWKRGCSFLACMAANAHKGLAANLCPENIPPPDPPIEVSEETEMNGGGGEKMAPEVAPAPEPTLALEPTPPPPSESSIPEPEKDPEPAVVMAEPEPDPEPAPPPPPGSASAPDPETPAVVMATPEQIEELVDRAKEVFPSRPRQWVLTLARKFSLRWVLAALARAKAKRSEAGEVRTGYVVRTLEGFAAEGGPPVDVASSCATAAEKAARVAAILAEWKAEMPEYA